MGIGGIETLPHQYAASTHIFAFPLAGLKVEGGIRFVDGIDLYSLPPRHWDKLEKASYVFNNYGAYVNIRPRFATFCFPQDLLVDEKNWNLLVRYCLARVRQLLHGLRLFKDGLVVEPELTMTCYRHNGRVARYNSAYRLLYAKLSGNDCYSLNCSDVTSVEKLAQLIRLYEAAGRNDAIDIGVRFFNWSWGPSLDKSSRLYALFSAAEAIFGGLGEEERMGARLADRILTACSFLEMPIAGLDDFLLKDAWTLRDAVAHGGADCYSDEYLDNAIRLLRAMLRPSLILALRAVILFPEIEDELRSKIGKVKGWGIKLALNRSLALAASESSDALKFILEGIDPNSRVWGRTLEERVYE